MDTNICIVIRECKTLCCCILHGLEVRSRGPATLWRFCDKLIENRGKLAIRVPSHTIAIYYSQTTRVSCSHMTETNETA